MSFCDGMQNNGHRGRLDRHDLQIRGLKGGESE